MITYNHNETCISFFRHICSLRGSVFPQSVAVALPVAIATIVLKILMASEDVPIHGEQIVQNAAAWSGFSFLVSFMVVFRSSQAYSRFCDGCSAMSRMRAEWFDACSLVISFCKLSQAEEGKTEAFKSTVARLFSMLHAVALAGIEDIEDGADIQAFKYEVYDLAKLDPASLRAVRRSHARVELVYQWLQQLIVQNTETGVLCAPAPLLSRVFQEVANGMVQYHEARKITRIPFPFPYTQSCDCLLMLHLLITPFVVSQWVESYAWAAIFGFIEVFGLWSLRNIAIQIENPFGQDENDLNAAESQLELNLHLQVMLSEEAGRTPACVRADPFGPRVSLSCMWQTHNNGSGSSNSVRDVGTLGATVRERCCPCRRRRKGRKSPGKGSSVSDCSEDVLECGAGCGAQLGGDMLERSSGASCGAQFREDMLERSASCGAQLDLERASGGGTGQQAGRPAQAADSDDLVLTPVVWALAGSLAAPKTQQDRRLRGPPAPSSEGIQSATDPPLVLEQGAAPQQHTAATRRQRDASPSPSAAAGHRRDDTFLGDYLH